MADFTGSKEDFANQMVATARAFLAVIEDFDALNQAFSVHGFQSGGANEYQDADFNTSNKQLTAAIVFDVMFAVGTVLGEVDAGQRNAFRECISGGLP